MEAESGETMDVNAGAAGPPLGDTAESFLRRGASAVISGAPDLQGPHRVPLAELLQLPQLPYAEPAFSSRLLREQLDPGTTDSSRPPAVVARQLDWLFASMGPRWRPRAVHHPLCGPGHYAAELRARGVRRYTGVDAGPSVVGHARRMLGNVPGFAFLNGDAADTGLLPADWEFDTLLLSYDAANFFSPDCLRRMLGPLVARLQEGGAVVCDLRLTEDGTAGFDEGRQVHQRPRGSVFCDGPHLLLSEGFVRDGGSVLGHRLIAVSERDPGRPEVFYSVLWVPSAAGITALLGSLGLEVRLIGRPFADSADPAHRADPNLHRHLVVARKRQPVPPSVLEARRQI
jgi:hypothetical protein